MKNPWKLATIGMALVGTTAVMTGVTTAYFIRPSAPEAPPPAPRPVRVPVASAGTFTPPLPPVATAPAPVAVPAPQPVSTAAAPADCVSGGDRALRIAKPGLVGTLIGAGVGAAGGAIADGGKGAGKGALIGGLAGAVLGSGYGAYKTRQECGTIFGDAGPAAATPPAPWPTEAMGPSPAAFRPARDEGLAVYSVR